MNEKAQAELDFWRSLFQRGENAFLKIRQDDLKEKTKFFKRLKQEHGQGLDLGCGLVSIFEFSKLNNVTACDPLMEEYDKIYKYPDSKVSYVQSGYDILPFPDNVFDWVFCVNVIDHTPDVAQFVSEIHRILKPGGRLYFEVNFDDNLASPHYGLWDESMVDRHLAIFKPRGKIKERNEKDRQWLYHAVFRKL